MYHNRTYEYTPWVSMSNFPVALGALCSLLCLVAALVCCAFDMLGVGSESKGSFEFRSGYYMDNKLTYNKYSRFVTIS